MSGREISLDLGRVRLAGLEWGTGNQQQVLALHGWLDNAASFQRLAPLLTGVHIVALDLLGHGRSQHRPPGTAFSFFDWPSEITAAADALGWQRYALLGHSMGAGISSLLPAVAPERIQRVVLLEGVGPLAAPAEQAPEQLAKALADERRIEGTTRRVYPDLDSAIRARMHGTELDAAAARLLVERGTEAVDGGVAFTFDQRLKARSRFRFTQDQVLAFLAAIRCPVLAVRASQGWPFPARLLESRLAAIPLLEQVVVKGGHHVHLTHPERVAPAINRFLSC